MVLNIYLTILLGLTVVGNAFAAMDGSDELNTFQRLVALALFTLECIAIIWIWSV